MMKQHKVRAVFADADGTLLDSHQNVTERTGACLKRFIQNGGKFAVVSARSPSGIRPIFRQSGLTGAMVSYSGALVMDETGHVLLDRGMPAAEAIKVIGMLQREIPECVWNLFSYDRWIVRDRSHPMVREEERIVRTTAQEGVAESAGGVVHKILCMVPPEQCADACGLLRKRFPDLHIVQSDAHLIEIMRQGVDKAKAAEVLLSFWRIGRGQTAAFGDYYNDAEMIAFAHYGVAMGNAPEQVKQKAGFVTADNDHDGIAVMMEKLGE